jgi:hypothetical protein
LTWLHVRKAPQKPTYALTIDFLAAELTEAGWLELRQQSRARFPLRANKRRQDKGRPLRQHTKARATLELEIKPCRARTSPKPADYTHLSRLSVKYALFGLWQSSEDQDQSVPMISF